MSLRRLIYKENNSLIGSVTAVAGSDVEAISLQDVTLDGTASTSSSGTIVSYEWSMVFGIGFYFDTQNSSTTTLYGNLVLGKHVVQLKVIDDLGNVDTDTIEITFVEDSYLSITSSIPNRSPDGSTATGTLNLDSGEAVEVIGLKFTLYTEELGNEVDFSGGVISTLSKKYPSRIGNATLDGSGNLELTYTATYGGVSSFRCEVIITSRSSGSAIPTIDRTNIDFYLSTPD